MTLSDQPGNNTSVIDLTPHSTSEENGKRACKFIIIEHQDRLHLVFGDLSSHKYHANLLHEYCERNRIESDWVHEPDLLEPLDSSIDVLGGGYLEIDAAAKKASFSGASKAYGPYHHHQLQAILNASSHFAKMIVRIG